MTLSKEKLFPLIILALLLLALPIAILLTKQKQDIRPRALGSAAANFALNPKTLNAKVGDTDVPVTVSLEVPDPKVGASGVNLELLYDKTKLKIKSVTSNVQAGSSLKFETEVLNKIDTMCTTATGYGCMRLSLVSKKATLLTGTINLATIKFDVIAVGDSTKASLKFGADSTLQVVGNNI
jgi:hypothetical protein